ncbi:hypothetical protein N7533_002845 [Penicillium manginii]|uniref:uncharacterized protein n=1 Tax=Penicillium manginii TaxID=203109 RepID=UPI0025481A33|nr:uncharacterized protein N7533_002845 [Penicillium manginii]KAJ5764164.1 hypothetical protein N7533_002845 [Penicillium manginii]
MFGRVAPFSQLWSDDDHIRAKSVCIIPSSDLVVLFRLKRASGGKGSGKKTPRRSVTSAVFYPVSLRRWFE